MSGEGAPDDATAVMVRALQAAGFQPRTIERDEGYSPDPAAPHNVITVDLPGQSTYEITIRPVDTDTIESNMMFHEWANDHDCSRLTPVFDISAHPAAKNQWCPLCGRTLGGGQPLQAIVIGPEPVDREAHATGQRYLGVALICCAECLQGHAPP
jgi:hypothetical protein